MCIFSPPYSTQGRSAFTVYTAHGQKKKKISETPSLPMALSTFGDSGSTPRERERLQISVQRPSHGHSFSHLHKHLHLNLLQTVVGRILDWVALDAAVTTTKMKKKVHLASPRPEQHDRHPLSPPVVPPRRPWSPAPASHRPSTGEAFAAVRGASASAAARETWRGPRRCCRRRPCQPRCTALSRSGSEGAMRDCERGKGSAMDGRGFGGWAEVAGVVAGGPGWLPASKVRVPFR